MMLSCFVRTYVQLVQYSLAMCPPRHSLGLRRNHHPQGKATCVPHFVPLKSVIINRYIILFLDLKKSKVNLQLI